MADATTASAALLATSGCQSVEVARAIDDAAVWLIVSRWDNVGSYRRALSNFEVKLAAVPLLATADGDVSAFEVLSVRSPSEFVTNESDLAADADTAGPT